MVWGINEPVKLERDTEVGTRPAHSYHFVIQEGYDVLPSFNPTLFWQGMEKAHTKFADILRGIGTWRYSGAPAISLHTKKGTRWHTNLDIAVLRQEAPFIEMTRRMATAGWYLFERKVHGGILPHTIKLRNHTKLILLEYVHPREELAIRKPNRNLVFVKVDQKGQIRYTDYLEDRVNVYLHHQEGERLVCSEDKFTCSPAEFQRVDYRFPTTTIPLITLEYLTRRKKQLVKEREYKHADPSKHVQDLLKLG